MNFFTALLAAIASGGYAKPIIDQPMRRTSYKKRGGGQGYQQPIDKARAKAWKKVFGGIACTDRRLTQFD